jgi:hypothetical protein
MSTTRPSPDKRGGAALCCQCGNLRTSPSTGLRTKRSDPNRTGEVDGDPRGWRMTRTLDCPICEVPTVHAMLCRWDHLRDRAEEFLYKRASWMR